jgi:hypothetical protein
LLVLTLYSELLWPSRFKIWAIRLTSTVILVAILYGILNLFFTAFPYIYRGQRGWSCK